MIVMRCHGGWQCLKNLVLTKIAGKRTGTDEQISCNFMTKMQLSIPKLVSRKT